MSTTIYNGQIIRKDIGEVYPIALKAADESRQKQTQWISGQTTIFALREVDARRWAVQKGTPQEQQDGIPYPDSPFNWAFNRLYDKEIREALKEMLSFDLCLFPLQGVGTLAILCSSLLLPHPWNDLPEVEDYGYWDNTDLPEGVTEDEWEIRRQHWSKALRFDDPAGNGIPSRSALTLRGANIAFPLVTDVVQEILGTQGQHREERLTALKERMNADGLAPDDALEQATKIVSVPVTYAVLLDKVMRPLA